jgi:hypothetical protein
MLPFMNSEITNMKLHSIWIALLCCLMTTPALRAQRVTNNDRPLRVYVGPISGPEEEFTHHVRARLVDELLERGVALVETEENADAVLTGERVQESTKKLRVGQRPAFCIRGDLKLVARRGALLWAGDVSSDRYAVSQSASFAQNAGKKIALALDEEAKRKSVLSALETADRRP